MRGIVVISRPARDSVSAEHRPAQSPGEVLRDESSHHWVHGARREDEASRARPQVPQRDLRVVAGRGRQSADVRRLRTDVGVVGDVVVPQAGRAGSALKEA